MKVLAPELESRLDEAANGAVREADAGDEVDGVPPRWVVSPADTDAVSRVLAVAHDAGMAVVARGTGTKLSWGRPPDVLDVVLDTTRLDRLVEHAAGDLVAVVQAGRRLDDLQADLATAGQWLAVDPPRPGTVGGLVATATTGPSRLFAGPVRDLVIGTTMVRADGVVAKSGGKVVKNVAGYDLGKLLTGSFGTLGVITQVAVRLHPLPEASSWVTVPVSSPGEAQRLVLAVQHSHLVPTAIELDWTGGTGTLAVRLDGIAPGVTARTETAREILGAGAEALDSAPDWWGTEPDGVVLLRVAYEVASLAAVLELLDDAPTRGSAGTGSLYVAVDPESAPTLVARLRPALSDLGGAVVVLEAPPDVKRQVDVWGPVGGLDLMRRVKDQFDPDRVLAPGRFVGGI